MIIPHPSQAMLSAMREHLELASVPISREKMDRALTNAWRAAEKVRRDEAAEDGLARDAKRVNDEWGMLPANYRAGLTRYLQLLRDHQRKGAEHGS